MKPSAGNSRGCNPIYITKRIRFWFQFFTVFCLQLGCWESPSDKGCRYRRIKKTWRKRCYCTLMLTSTISNGTWATNILPVLAWCGLRRAVWAMTWFTLAPDNSRLLTGARWRQSVASAAGSLGELGQAPGAHETSLSFLRAYALLLAARRLRARTMLCLSTGYLRKEREKCDVAFDEISMLDAGEEAGRKPQGLSILALPLIVRKLMGGKQAANASIKLKREADRLSSQYPIRLAGKRLTREPQNCKGCAPVNKQLCIQRLFEGNLQSYF